MSAEPGILLSVDAAAMLGVKPQTLRKWRLSGTGPAYIRLGGPLGRTAYRRSDIDAWLSRRTFSSTSDETARR